MRLRSIRAVRRRWDKPALPFGGGGSGARVRHRRLLSRQQPRRYHFRIYASPRPNVSLDDIEKAINEQIATLLADGVTEDELAR
ncbi:MAG: hypothetical protein R3D03_01660 [Geminicoccaceae bacterium]